MITASVDPNAARTRARSCSPTTGRAGPFNCFTEASLFTPMTTLSPNSRHCSSSVMWPTCKMSKQPLVNTIRSPFARHSAKRTSKWSRSRILSGPFIWVDAVNAATRSLRETGAVPVLATTMPAAIFASVTAVSGSRPAASDAGQGGNHRVAGPGHVKHLACAGGGMKTSHPGKERECPSRSW